MWASVAGGSNRADAGSNAGGEAGVATAAPPAFSAPETPTPTETTDSVPPTPAAPAATPSAKPDEITFLVKVAGQPEFTGTVRSVSSERVLSLKLHAQNLYKWMWDICAREQFTLLASPDRPCTSLTPLNDLERRVGDELRRIAPEHSGDWFLVIRLHCFAAVWKPYQREWQKEERRRRRRRHLSVPRATLASHPPYFTAAVPPSPLHLFSRSLSSCSTYPTSFLDAPTPGPYYA